MKLKNRNYLFLVERFDEEKKTSVSIAAFLTLESAEEYSGECSQDFEDRGISGFLFNVVPIIYYDL